MNHYFPARLTRGEASEDFAARAAKYAGRYGALRPFLHPVREGLRPCWEGPPVAPTGKNTLVIPDLFGTAPSTWRWRHRSSARSAGTGRSRSSRTTPARWRAWSASSPFIPLRQAALVREPAFPLDAARAIPPALPDRPRLGLAPLEGDKAGPRGALWAGATSDCSEPSIWPSSWPFASIFAAGLDDHRLRRAQGPVRRADPAADRAGAHRAGRGPGRARVAGEYWTRGSRLFHTAGWRRRSPSCGS
jgi:hypothetical protein